MVQKSRRRQIELAASVQNLAEELKGINHTLSHTDTQVVVCRDQYNRTVRLDEQQFSLYLKIKKMEMRERSKESKDDNTQ